MKKIIGLLFIATAVFLSCKQRESYPKAENAMDAGREFIDGCLKGEFKKADFYMLPDGQNKEELAKLENAYDRKGADDRVQYRQASIIIDHEEILADSIHLIYYRNSYDKIARKVKIINRNGSWLVDLKYTFDGNL